MDKQVNVTKLEPEKEPEEEEFDWNKVIPNKNTEWIDLQHKRIRFIPEDALENLPKCDYVCLRYNLIKDMSPVGKLNFNVLTELDLYDNHIKVIDGIENLVNLTNLDLSYNNIKSIQQLSKLTKLKTLYLCSNKISKIENLEGLEENLETLELGANKIKIIENLPNFKNLKELHLAKNKIEKIEGVPDSIYGSLKILTLQENRISKIEQLDKFQNLEELYMGSNNITCIEGVEKLDKLNTLDLAHNPIETIGNGLTQLTNLTDVWLNSCKISNWKDVDSGLGSLNENLDTVYLEHNPIANEATYRNKLKLICKNLTQIDATSCV